MRLLYSFFLSILLLFSVFHSKAQTLDWQFSGSGPYGGAIKSVVKKGDTVILAVATPGIYRSLDNGESWSMIDSLSLTKMIRAGNRLLGYELNHLYRSDDFGATWIESENGIIGNPSFSRIAAITDSIIMISSSEDIYRSIDGGENWYLSTGSLHTKAMVGLDSAVVLCNTIATWQSVDYGATYILGGPPSTGECLAANHQSKKILMGTNYDGIYISDDFGYDWMDGDYNMKDYIIEEVGFAGDDMWVCTAVNGAFVSHDDGETFLSSVNGISNDYNNSFLPENRISSFCAGDSEIFLGTDASGLFVSHDEGNNWSKINIAPAFVRSLAVQDGEMYAQGLDIFYSNDGSNSWVEKDSGYYTQETGSNIVPANPACFISSSSGAFATFNGGQFWQKLTNGLPEKKLKIFRFDENTLLAITDSFLYESTDGGQSWFVNSSVKGPTSSGASMAFIDSTIFTVGSNFLLLYKKLNSPLWTEVYSGVTELLAIDSNLYGADEQYFNRNVLKFDFDTYEWKHINSGLEDSSYNFLFTAHKRLFNIHYFGTYLFDDTTQTWSKIIDGLYTGVPGINSVIENGGEILAAAGALGILKFNLSDVFDDYDIWPGDADNDGEVGNTDLFAIGLGYGESGFERANPTILWNAQYSDNWNNSLPSGVNYKYTDCNGDGTINADDTTAINLNFGLTHPFFAPEDNEVRDGAPLYLEFSSDTVQYGNMVSASVKFGDSFNPVDSIYAIAFTIHLDPSLIDAASLSFTVNSSWLGDTDNLLSIRKNSVDDGDFIIAITRINHLNASGFGEIGTFTFKTFNDSSGSSSTAEFSTNQITAIDSKGNFIDVIGASTALFLSNSVQTVVDESPPSSPVVFFPNPATDLLFIDNISDARIATFEIYNGMGGLVKKGNIINKSILIGDLNIGLYFIRILTDKGNSYGKFIKN